MRKSLVAIAIAAAGCAESRPVVDPPNPTVGPPGAGGVIAGIVHQANGLPLAGATIAVGRTSVVADANGAFRIEQVAPGDHKLLVGFDHRIYELGQVKANTELDLAVTLGMRHLDGELLTIPPSAQGAADARTLALHGTDVGTSSSSRHF